MLTISAYLDKRRLEPTTEKDGAALVDICATGGRYLLGELDVVEDDEWSDDIQDCPVVDSWGNVVVAFGRACVYLCD